VQANVVNDDLLVTRDNHFVHPIFLFQVIYGFLLVGMSGVKEGESVAWCRIRN